MALHPGEHLRLVYLEPMNLGVQDLARHLGVSSDAVERLLAGTDDLSAVMAMRLAHALGHTPEIWMALQTAYSLEQAAQHVDPASVTPVPFTDDTGWIPVVPHRPGRYEWRLHKDEGIHQFEVFNTPLPDGRVDTAWRCYSLTDFGFIRRNEGEWRRTLPTL